MENHEWKIEILSDLKIFFKWIVSSLLDASFLILWVYMQQFASQIINQFTLEEIDKIQLSIFQILFAVTTLVPIIAYVFIDITKLYFQAKRNYQSLRKAENLTGDS